MAQPKQNMNDKDKNKKNKSDNNNKHVKHDHSHKHGPNCNHHNHTDNNNEEKKQQHTHKHTAQCQHGHGHSHSGGCQHEHSHSGGCQHDHDDGDEVMSNGTSLYQLIDKKNIKCLNESVSNAGKAIFKPYDERLDTSVFVESDIDGELLFTVYFTAEVTLRSIQLTMNEEDSAPTTLQLWNDKQDKIDFDNYMEHKCNQSIVLAFDNECKLHYKTRQHKFNDLTILKMLFKKDAYDEDDNDTEIRLNYIGLKGDYKGPKSRRAVHTIYEVAANPNDHATIANAKQQNSSKNDFVDGK